MGLKVHVQLRDGQPVILIAQIRQESIAALAISITACQAPRRPPLPTSSSWISILLLPRQSWCRLTQLLRLEWRR